MAKLSLRRCDSTRRFSLALALSAGSLVEGSPPAPLSEGDGIAALSALLHAWRGRRRERKEGMDEISGRVAC